MASDQIWFDARVDAMGNISGALGCAIGMPTCSGVWLGEIVTLDMENDSLALPFELRNRDKSHLGGFVNVTYDWEAWEASLGLRVDPGQRNVETREVGAAVVALVDTGNVVVVARRTDHDQAPSGRRYC